MNSDGALKGCVFACGAAFAFSCTGNDNFGIQGGESGSAGNGGNVVGVVGGGGTGGRTATDGTGGVVAGSGGRKTQNVGGEAPWGPAAGGRAGAGPLGGSRAGGAGGASGSRSVMGGGAGPGGGMQMGGVTDTEAGAGNGGASGETGGTDGITGGGGPAKDDSGGVAGHADSGGVAGHADSGGVAGHADSGGTPGTVDSSTSTDAGSSCRPDGTIVVTASTDNHQGYFIDGLANPDLTLCRGSAYEFSLNVTSLHPFWIKTQPSTGSGDGYRNGVSNNGATSGDVVFVVPSDAPDTLYYACEDFEAMHGVIHIVAP